MRSLPRLRLLVLVLLSPPPPAALAMSRSEAIRELRLPRSGFTERQVKTAYRQRSLEAHPDKGGSEEEFIRVAEAYEELSGGGGGGGGGARKKTFGEGGGPTSDQMRQAEDMFFDMFDDLFDEDTVGGAVDSLFAQFGGGGTGAGLGYGTKMLKGFIKWILPKFMRMLESEGTTININGRTMSGQDFKEWRAQRRARREVVANQGDL